jgi:hypothetical protein
MKAFAGIAAAAWAVAAGSAFAGHVTVASPGGYAAIRIEDDVSCFPVQWRGETIVSAAPAFGTLALESRENTEVDREIPLVATKASVARDRHRGATLTFRESGARAQAQHRRARLRRRRCISLSHRRSRVDTPGRRADRFHPARARPGTSAR